MVQTREERAKKKKETAKIYYENNKEHLAEKAREYYQNNKEHRQKYFKEYNEKNKEHLTEQKREYRQTPAGKKSTAMKVWRYIGVKNVNDELYNDYIDNTYCESCLKEYISSFDKCLDHDHETGKFRWFICRNCNTKDNWKKITH